MQLLGFISIWNRKGLNLVSIFSSVVTNAVEIDYTSLYPCTVRMSDRPHPIRNMHSNSSLGYGYIPQLWLSRIHGAYPLYRCSPYTVYLLPFIPFILREAALTLAVRS